MSVLKGKQAVEEFLPHRGPFLFIDSVEKLSPGPKVPPHSKAQSLAQLVGSTVWAHYKVPHDHPILAGHFPGHPILPGVVQIEMMAQALAFALTFFEGTGHIGQGVNMGLATVRQAKFRRPIFPGDALLIKAQVALGRGNILLGECEVWSTSQGEELLMGEANILISTNLKGELTGPHPGAVA